MKKNRKRQEIFQAALWLFGRFGFKKTSLEQVAAEAGMTKGNIYFYVRDKQDLYEQTVRFALSQWRDSMADSIIQDTDPLEKFVLLARRSAEYLSQHEDLRNILINDPTIFSVTPREDRFSDVNEEAKNILHTILREGVQEGRFHPMDMDLVAEFLFSVYILYLIKVYVKSEGLKIGRAHV